MLKAWKQCRRIFWCGCIYILLLYLNTLKRIRKLKAKIFGKISVIIAILVYLDSVIIG